MIRKFSFTTLLIALIAAAAPAFAQNQRFASIDANGNLDSPATPPQTTCRRIWCVA